jgi:hypothetical protein
MPSPLNYTDTKLPAVLCSYAILDLGINGCTHGETRSYQNSRSQRSLLHRLAVLHAVPISISNTAVLYFIFVTGVLLNYRRRIIMLNLSGITSEVRIVAMFVTADIQKNISYTTCKLCLCSVPIPNFTSLGPMIYEHQTERWTSFSHCHNIVSLRTTEILFNAILFQDLLANIISALLIDK